MEKGGGGGGVVKPRSPPRRPATFEPSLVYWRQHARARAQTFYDHHIDPSASPLSL